jgi:ABC-2 type transport system ATP-binding protein
MAASARAARGSALTHAAELRAVRKCFASVTALEGIDLHVDPGEIVALLGPNGAGKTTAIRILLGLRRPDLGRALLFGLDPRQPEARRRCGVTPQETDLPDTLRVREILDFVRAHFTHPVHTAQLLAQFGLEQLVHRQAGGLSGGERRRVAVALAFAGDPELVFLDEPSSGLDLASRRSLWDSIRSFSERGRSILLTTHDLAEAEALATRVVALECGRVVLGGSVQEIAERAGLQRVRIRSQPLPPLSAVEHATEDGRHTTLFTRRPEELIRALVTADVDLGDLEVVAITLEQALELHGKQ